MRNCPRCGSDKTEVGDWVQDERGDEVGVGTWCLACGYHSHSDDEDGDDGDNGEGPNEEA